MNNKKGFTLIELLAVIIILALILVLAVPSVLSTMNTAKKKTFQMYGQKLVNAAMTLQESYNALGGNTNTHKYDGKSCYSIADLGINGSGAYNGFVVVEKNDSTDAITGYAYTVYLTDGNYAYNGVTSDKVTSGDQDSIVSTSSVVESVGEMKCQ